MAGPLEGYGDQAKVYKRYQVDRLAWRRQRCGELTLGVGRLRVTAAFTGEVAERTVAVLGAESPALAPSTRAWVREDPDAEATGRVTEALLRRAAERGPDDLATEVATTFGGRVYGARDLFVDTRRRWRSRARESGAPVPESLAAEAARLGIAPGLDRQALAGALESSLLAAVGRLEAGVTATPEEALAVLELGRRLGVEPDLWTAQNRVFRLGRDPAGRSRSSRPAGRPPGAALAGSR
jgi:hypothetical protein